MRPWPHAYVEFASCVDASLPTARHYGAARLQFPTRTDEPATSSARSGPCQSFRTGAVEDSVLTLARVESLVQVPQKVVDILESDGDPDHVICYARLPQLLR